MKRKTYFGPELFDFLRELRENNNRQWFLANKGRYEAQVRDPMLRFIGDFGVILGRISRRFVVDPRPVGGSLFRIYRDTRFSSDKSPYKTMVAAHFRHQSLRNVHAPGFYLHLEPGNVFSGAGLWRPDAITLARVRDALVADPDAWTRATSGKVFKTRCSFWGEKLQRPPRGYPGDHPLVEDLKRKDIVTITRFDEGMACGGDFLDRYAEACRACSPLVEFLTRALGLRW